MSYRILVVDDTKFMRKMLTDMLKQFGYEVVGEADNGRQAVEKFVELRPDVVMLDITMPEMDGIEAMREMRKIDPEVTVLICSAMSQQDLISDALKAGANGYVMKPFKPNRVNEIIRKYAIPKAPAPAPKRTEPAPAPIVEEAVPNVLQFPKQVQEAAAEEPEEQQVPIQEQAVAVTEPAAEEVVAETFVAEVVEEVAEIVDEVVEEVAEVVEAAVTDMPELEVQTPEAIMEPAAEPVEEQRMQQEIESLPDVLSVPMQDPVHKVMTLDSTELPLPNVMDLEAPETVSLLTGEEKELLMNISMEQEAELEPVQESVLEPELSTDLEPSGDGEEDLSLDDLQELTMLMTDTESVPVAQTSSNRQESVSMPNDDASKVITLNWRNNNVKNFTSSYMCNWTEDQNGDLNSFLVICTESENRISIECANKENQRQQLNITLDGFKQLMAWLEDKLASNSTIRELPKKAEM